MVLELPQYFTKWIKIGRRTCFCAKTTKTFERVVPEMTNRYCKSSGKLQPTKYCSIFNPFHSFENKLIWTFVNVFRSYKMSDHTMEIHSHSFQGYSE